MQKVIWQKNFCSRYLEDIDCKNNCTNRNYDSGIDKVELPIFANADHSFGKEEILIMDKKKTFIK